MFCASSTASGWASVLVVREKNACYPKKNELILYARKGEAISISIAKDEASSVTKLGE